MQPLFQVLVDAAVWCIIHFGLSYAFTKCRRGIFFRDSWLYRLRWWEQEGRLYERMGVKRWKRFAPDGGGWFADGFRKRLLTERNAEYLHVFVAETKRAELTHWLSIPPALLFFLWHKPAVGMLMVLYALLLNIPLILIQRYNRIRLERVLQRRR